MPVKRLGRYAAEALEGDRQVVEGTAGDGAVGVHLAVLHAEGALGELGGHAEQAGQDHPEGGAGAAEGHRDADAGDVAEADGAGEGRGQRLEVRHLARVRFGRVPSPDNLQRGLESAELDEAEVEREDDTGRDQPRHDGGEADGSDRDGEEDNVGENFGHGLEDGINRGLDGGYPAIFLMARHR